MEKPRASSRSGWRLVAIGLVMTGAVTASAEAQPPPDDLFRALRSGCVAATEVAGRRTPPPPAAEPPATVMQAFYTCPAVPVPVLRIGRGRIVVGPTLRG